MKLQYGLIVEDSPEELLAAIQQTAALDYTIHGGIVFADGKYVALMSRKLIALELPDLHSPR